MVKNTCTYLRIDHTAYTFVAENPVLFLKNLWQAINRRDLEYPRNFIGGQILITLTEAQTNKMHKKEKQRKSPKGEQEKVEWLKIEWLRQVADLLGYRLVKKPRQK